MRRSVGAHVVSTLLLAFVLLCAEPTSALIPYEPSYLLYSLDHNGSFAYLLHSGGSSQNVTTELLALNVSEVVDAAEPHYSTLTSSLPFQHHGNGSAYVPTIDAAGVIKVFAGSCRDTLDQGALWQFTPKANDSAGNGTWEQLAIDSSATQSSVAVDGPNFLSAGFAYAPTNTSDSSIYTFGGMCPFTNATNQTWMAAANYSQSMIVLNPHTSGDTVSYDASTTGSRAPPIAEAGFTITPLQASYAYSSTGEPRKQQDFLLIGGQTRDAFINMSQLAVFSLPQNSWSFANVMTAPTTLKTELAVREVNVVEPRSGHTAVLSPDGSKVIVYGGWVGNTSVAAQPQLAILELEADYEEWTWRIPSITSSGIGEAAGIYGHGATMLPGGVMMIAGGQTIPHLSSKLSSRSSLNTSQVYLYNVTSGHWISTYENPYSRKDSVSDSGTSSSRTKTGLGVGLGLGIPAVICLAVFLFFYSRRRYERRSRDRELRNLALGAQRAHFWGGEGPTMASSIRRPFSGEMEEIADWGSKRGSGQSSVWRDKAGGTIAESTGLLGEALSPTKTNLSGPTARLYRPPTQYSEFRRSDATGEIHPIDEREEDEAKNAGMIITQETYDQPRGSAFLPPLGANIGYSAVPLVPPEFIAGIGIDQDGGSASPDKGDRTSSNLSDSSTTSAKSIMQARALNLPHLSSSNQSISGRQIPLKSTEAASAYSSGGASSNGSSRETPRSRPNSMALSFVEQCYTSDSYSTAQTSVSQRHSEGEHLLQHHQHSQSLEEPTSPLAHTLELFPMPDSKPTALPTVGRPRASDWIGNNVRRVLSLTRRRPPTADFAEPPGAFTSIASGIDINLDRRSTIVGNGSSSSSRPSPVTSLAAGYGNTRIPRRSVSASAELFRRKQGARDWGAGKRSSVAGPSWRDDMGVGDERAGLYSDGLRRYADADGEEDGDDDWDVEGAAEGRRVQVTFTVPKEKLRVVNATAGELDGVSERSVSGGILPRMVCEI
ncbi:hypothetical protein ASPACDRAFT_78479 [Aspergillus aculeatus ATCC 16872]|uniref:Attractin/MKLN-like beta-propeller domain-containing protein n=1 Tax=Aspergillus aculeatus (strain ATCC 16872 / CBS 172.66 / WB 5094) TaxID=690307 RepID=A0A1L9WWE7_ASPA1|nr:uncharacterized protein ASPACDRAFT_78479 [Aspergillus aculeatus ATCC 16872]OJK00530.1 hypothetical protein ASPACDRAFT_78479 [Aspergillus aculeatus ATCC 16872]